MSIDEKCTHPKPQRLYFQSSFEDGVPAYLMGTCATCKSDYSLPHETGREKYPFMYRNAQADYNARILSGDE